MRVRIVLCLMLVVAAAAPLSANGTTATVYEYSIYPTFSLQFAGSEGIVVDASGNIYFGAQDTRTVYGPYPRAVLVRIDPLYNRLYYWYLPDLEQVGALAYDRARNTIWIADPLGAKLCKFNTSTKQYTVSDLSEFMSDGALTGCCSIAVDASGLVYLALYIDSRVAIFAPTDLEIMSIDVPVGVSGADPYGIAVTADGDDIYYTCSTATDAFVHVEMSTDEATFTEFELDEEREPTCILIDEHEDNTVYFTEGETGNVGRYVEDMDSPLNEYILDEDPTFGIAQAGPGGDIWTGIPDDDLLALLDPETTPAATLDFTIASDVVDPLPDPDSVPDPTVSTLRTKGPYSIRPQYLSRHSWELTDGIAWHALTWDGYLGAVAAKKVGSSSEGWGLEYDNDRILRIKPSLIR